MDREHSAHAKNLVKAFKEKLSPSGRDHVGIKHFEELEVLVEVALATAVNEEREQVAASLDALSRSLRNKEYSD